MKKISLIICLALVAVACRLETKTKTKTGPLHIVATTGIIGDVLTNIVGDSAEVTALMGPGTDPHLYKPTPGDIELLDEADVIVSNGLHLEGKMAEMLDKYGREKPVLKVADGIEKTAVIQSVDFAESYDPHIWFDAEIWMDGFAHITQELGKIDSVSAPYFNQNYEAYRANVDAMDHWVQSEIAQLSDTSKVLITSHDAFSYFGRRYGIEVKGIQGISTLSEVGLKDVANMVDFVIDRNIKSIFVETSTSDKTAKSIADGALDKNYELKIDGPLYSDALGEPDSDAGTYIGMVKANAAIIVNGLK